MRGAAKRQKLKRKLPKGRHSLGGVHELLKTIKALRNPKTGCPWDLAQTHESLMKYFFEELHEFNEALSTRGPHDPSTIEELGDVLLQIVLHAEMLSESGASDFNKLSFNLAAKIRLRHPHVFDAKFGRFKSADEVSAAWESIKAYGRSKTASKSKPGDRSKRPSNFDRMFQDVPAQMPGLSRAARLGEKAATLGFDWPKAEDVLDKINEEFQELKSSLNDEKEGPKELGDLLFAAAQLARLKGWDPEAALRSCERKFVERLGLMNQELQSQNKDWHSQSLVELESLWQKTKKLTPNT
jgi:ATP diphosphatase